jgi:hypothetical protein
VTQILEPSQIVDAVDASMFGAAALLAAAATLALFLARRLDRRALAPAALPHRAVAAATPLGHDRRTRGLAGLEAIAAAHASAAHLIDAADDALDLAKAECDALAARPRRV